MASGDFLDLSEHACRAAQLDPADTTGDLVQAKAKVNEGYTSCLADGNPWDFLEREGQFDTVASSDKYTYSSIVTAASITGATIREIVMMVNDTTGNNLRSTSWEHLESMTFSTKETAEGTGEPFMWAKWGSLNAAVVRLYPNPNRVYRIGFKAYCQPAVMSNNTDVPLLPYEWTHRVLVPYAAWKLLLQEGGNEALNAAQVHRKEYEDAVAAMRNARAVGKVPTFNAIQPGLLDSQFADDSMASW